MGRIALAQGQQVLNIGGVSERIDGMESEVIAQ